MRLLGSVLLTALLVCGCASTRYVDPQGDVRKEQRIGVECRALAEQSVPPGGLLRGVIVEDHVRQCFEGHGLVAAQKVP